MLFMEFIIDDGLKFGIDFCWVFSSFFRVLSSSSVISLTILIFSSNIQKGHESIEDSWRWQFFCRRSLFFNKFLK